DGRRYRRWPDGRGRRALPQGDPRAEENARPCGRARPANESGLWRRAAGLRDQGERGARCGLHGDRSGEAVRRMGGIPEGGRRRRREAIPPLSARFLDDCSGGMKRTASRGAHALPDAARPLILGVGGTTRPGSTTERALRVALRAAAAEGAETVIITAQDLVLPMYTTDLAGRT